MHASEIAQSYLDEVATYVMADNWEGYADSISRPFLLITHEKTMTFATPDEIRSIFTDFRILLQTQRVTDFIRLVETSQQIDEKLISARYVTHLMSGGHRIMEPVQSSISLRLEGNRWRAASITNALSNSSLAAADAKNRRRPPMTRISAKGPDHD